MQSDLLVLIIILAGILPASICLIKFTSDSIPMHILFKGTSLVYVICTIIHFLKRFGII